jgi:DNA polymerase IV
MGAGVMSPRTIFHVDMDAFFANVEIRDDPKLRGKPVLVGGVARRGVVAAASYEARKFGCHSAQPMAVALRMCPHAVVLPGRHEAYERVSEQVFEIFGRFSPCVEGLSIDEAFLDMTGTERLLGPPRRAAEDLRSTVRRETNGLTCSVGISAVKFVAKIASGCHKPDGLTEVPAGGELDFLAPLAIDQLWGVGPKTAAKLREHGVHTIGDLSRFGAESLASWFGEHGMHLYRLSRGLDEREVIAWRERKQISHEDTYATDVVGEEALKRKLLSQATRVADRVVKKKLLAKRVQLKIRDTTFHTESRQCTLPRATDDARAFYSAACDLLRSVELEGRRFRLTGIGVGAFEPAHRPGEQLDLPMDGKAPPPKELQAVVSAVRERWGHQALYPADATEDARPGSAGGLSNTRRDE